jgi:hypothetical protein
MLIEFIKLAAAALPHASITTCTTGAYVLYYRIPPTFATQYFSTDYTLLSAPLSYENVSRRKLPFNYLTSFL